MSRNSGLWIATAARLKWTSCRNTLLTSLLRHHRCNFLSCEVLSLCERRKGNGTIRCITQWDHLTRNWLALKITKGSEFAYHGLKTCWISLILAVTSLICLYLLSTLWSLAAFEVTMKQTTFVSTALSPGASSTTISDTLVYHVSRQLWNHIWLRFPRRIWQQGYL